MRLVIIDQENNMMQVGIDGLFYSDLEGSQLSDSIHAVQWDGDSGEVEYKDPTTGDMTHNEDIASIDAFQFAIDAWDAAKAEEEAAIAAAEAEAAEAESEEIAP